MKIVKMRIAIILVGIGLGAGFLIGSARAEKQVAFSELSSEEMHSRLIEERDVAIEKAVEEGDYECCINPPCTMCYMEGNRWNNFKAGTCACDNLIAEGKEPCPQCKNGLCYKDQEGICKINQE